MLKQLCEKYPYKGMKNWALFCSLVFIVSELLWYLSSFVRDIDFLEIPMVFFYFPLATLIDSDALLHNDYIYLYALTYWGSVFFLSFLFSRRKINLIIPGIIVIIISCLPGAIYSAYLLWRGPIIMT